MMGGTTPLTGPDLQIGLPISEVPDGGLLRGHAFGEPIVLARRGEAFYAVGATCTHYNGPLDQGLMVGDTVRCPWHHACFDLRTGHAVRAPALRSLPRFTTEVAEGRVRVTGPAPEIAPVPRAGGPDSVVVVGSGAAAAAAVEVLRREGYAGPISMIGREAPVDRPNLSKDYLAGTAPEEWMPLRDEAFYAEHRITLRTGEVTAIAPESRRVVMADGSHVPYGACLLATGADPIRLPIPGADRPDVFTLRTLADSRAIIAAATGSARVVVLGASFIGLEAAASLRARGLAVDVVAPEAVPLERVLGAKLGAFVRGIHEEHGVVFHLGLTATAIDDEGVLLSDGSRLAADLVVMGVGVRPNLAVAERAGLAVDKGVLVDAWLRTSAEGVWAAGDIAKWPDPHTGQPQRIEHWVLAQRQGQAAARNLLGGAERFEAIPFFWSAHYDVTVNWVGFPGGDRVDIDGDLAERSVAVAYRKGNVTYAVATIGRDDVSLKAERMLEEDDQAGLLRLIPAR